MASNDDTRRRIARLQRIEKLRRQLHDMSTWKRAALAQERERLASDHALMIEALGDGLMAFGPPSMAGTRRVRRLAQELEVAGRLEKDMQDRALAEGRLAKLAQGTLHSAREAYREGQERRSLEELIEATVAGLPASRKP